MGEGEPTKSGRGWVKKWESVSKKWEEWAKVGEGTKSDENSFYNPI